MTPLVMVDMLTPRGAGFEVSSADEIDRLITQAIERSIDKQQPILAYAIVPSGSDQRGPGLEIGVNGAAEMGWALYNASLSPGQSGRERASYSTVGESDDDIIYCLHDRTHHAPIRAYTQIPINTLRQVTRDFLENPERRSDAANWEEENPPPSEYFV